MTHKGQALAESLPFIPLMLLFLALMMLFTQWFLIRQKLLIAVRLGAFIYSAGRSTPAETQRQVMDYLTRPPLALETSRITLQVGRLKNNPQARMFELDEVRVRYQLTDRLSRLFGQKMEERCVIKHASHYGPPYQTRYGPAVSW